MICYYIKHVGASGDVMVSKLDKQTFTSDFESHYMLHLYDLVPRLCKKKAQ